MQHDIIQRIFDQINSSAQDFEQNPNLPPANMPNSTQQTPKQRVYIGFKIYTIMLDAEGDIKEIFSSSENTRDLGEIKAVAYQVLENHKTSSAIGNLLFREYAFLFHDHSLILIDLAPVRTSLHTALAQTILIALLGECIILFIAYSLTKWIMKPILDSFDRQKEFIADASHELKTPLSVIIASSEMYDQDHDPRWVNDIKSEAERMSSLTKKLLDLSKSEQENIVFTTHNLSNIIEKSVLTTESLFYEKKLKLNYSIDEKIHFECNKEQIKELVYILVDNAIQHCDRHGHVNIFLTKNRKRIVFKVENTGKPIPVHKLDKIFERFYRGDSARDRTGGHYGLGLAIAKNIVENHHGTINAYSNKGITTFQIIWTQK